MPQYNLAEKNIDYYERGVTMPLSDNHVYTAEDYWNLPDGRRAELIKGKLYDLASPSRVHQELVGELYYKLVNYIKANNGSCKVYPAPFAVNLHANDKTFVEPDISVICDPNKLSVRGCEGAPDFIIEIVSPSGRRMDYNIKNALYAEAGVREYWIVDPDKECTTVYRYEKDAAPMIIPFDQPIQVGIYDDLQINISELLSY